MLKRKRDATDNLGKQYKKRKARAGSMRLYKTVPTGNPVPEKFNAKLSYCSIIALNGGIFTTADYYFRCNSLFDPDYTGGGHQPMGFDQLMALYKKFVVNKAKIMCHFQIETGSTITPGFVAVRKITTPDTPANFEEVTESQGAIIKTINADQLPVLALTYDRLKDHPGSSINDDNEYGTDAANPTDVHYFHVSYLGTGSGDPQPFSVHVKIDFDAVFFDPKVLGQS